MKGKLFILLMVLLLMIPLGLAEPPFQDTEYTFELGLTIEQTYQYYYKQNYHHTFRFQVLNHTTGRTLNDTKTKCIFNLKDDYGNFLYTNYSVDYNKPSWNINLSSSYFDTIGHYQYYINCYSLDGEVGGFRTSRYEVTPYGLREDENDAYAALVVILFILGLLFIVVFFTVKVKGIIMQLSLTTFSLFLVSFGFFMLYQSLSYLVSSSIDLLNILLTFYDIFLTLGWLGLAITFISIIIGIFTSFMDKQRKKRGLDEDDDTYG